MGKKKLEKTKPGKRKPVEGEGSRISWRRFLKEEFFLHIPHHAPDIRSRRTLCNRTGHSPHDQNGNGPIDLIISIIGTGAPVYAFITFDKFIHRLTDA
jgi:hypothetical protein